MPLPTLMLACFLAFAALSGAEHQNASVTLDNASVTLDAVVAPAGSDTQLAVNGCSPLGRNVAGDVEWLGCPTAACGDANGNPCEPGQNDTDTRGFCKCQDGTVSTCSATLNLDAFGLVTGFGCAKNGCPVACTLVGWPPPVGPNKFLFCDC
jgi:hypothetical protein